MNQLYGFDQPRQRIEKQRRYFVNKGTSSQGYGFSSDHVWMWELDCEESWVPKNWCFWTMVLEKTLESPLDCKEIQPVHPKQISPGCSLEGQLLKLKLQYFGHLIWRVDSLEKTVMLGGIGVRRRGEGEDEMAGWHHPVDGHKFDWTLGVGDWQGGQESCNSWGHKKLDMTEQWNWTELKVIIKYYYNPRGLHYVFVSYLFIPSSL